MTRIFLLSFFIFICHDSFAQQKEVDSLLTELKKNTAEDTVRLNLLNNLTFDYSQLDYNKAIETGDEAIQLAIKLNNTSKLATAYRYKGLSYASMRNDSAAMDMYKRAMKLYWQLNNKNGVANGYHSIGMLYISSADYYTALEYEQKALYVSQEINNRVLAARILNSIGIIYLDLTNYSKALEYYLQTIKYCDETGDKFGKANALTNIGLVYNHLNQYSKALEFHQKSADLFEELDSKAGTANCFGNIGVVYDNLSKPRLALEYYKKGLVLQKELGNKRGIAAAFTNIGVTDLNLSMYEQAYENFRSAIEICKGIDDKNVLADALHFMGELYLKAPATIFRSSGEASQNKFARAIDYNQRSLRISTESGDLAQQLDAWLSISDAYKAENKFKESLNAYEKYTAFKDSIYNDDKKQNITRLEMQYEFDKKEAVTKATNDAARALANSEIRQQKIIKNAVMGGAVVLLLATIISFIFYKRRRDAIAEKATAQFEAQVADNERKVLRLQMNPHFIFNSLNSISDFISKNDTASADKYLAKFAKVMRMILENSDQKEIALADDLKALELYMQLEALRLKHKFTYEISVDSKIDQQNTLIPPLMLQPFVENSIWHGISKKEGAGKIWIHIEKESDMIHFIVEDNGVGRKQSFASKTSQDNVLKKSLGMKITKARIDIINRLKNSNGGVTMSDLEEGTKIDIRLPEALAF